MNAIIINNRVTLVDDFSSLKMSIIVPKRNLQRMRELTKCKILSKEPTRVAYNNYAGDLFKVTISVTYKSIVDYLNDKSVHEAANANDYLSLLNEKWPNIYYCQTNLKGDSVNLYAFGNCYYDGQPSLSTIYYAVNGSKKSIINRDLNDFGRKRIIRLKGKYYSNRNF